MAKKKKIDIKQVIADALEHYHKMKPSIKESTKRQNESLLSEFYRFVDTLLARDRTMKIFSQKGLNRYKEYLIDKMNSTKTGDKKRNFGVGQLNRCGSIIARLINNVLYPEEVVPNSVVWIKVEDPRREDQKGHIPLLDDEVAAIENCSGLSDVEKEYRDIFLLQIESGQRVSDLANILTGEYTVGQVDGYECIILETKKEDVPAAVALIPKVRMLLERIKTHKHVDPKEFKDKTDGGGNNTYNEAIRRIAKKAGLDRIIVKIDTNKRKEKKPLYEVITNHDARSTFITNKIRAGMTPDEIAVFTGHVNGEMIRRIYAQPTIEDKLRNVKQYLSGGKKEKRMQEDSSVPVASPAVPKKVQVDKVKAAEMPTRIPGNDSNPFDVFKNYLDGLKKIVDIGLAEADKADAMQECIDNDIESISVDNVDIEESSWETDHHEMIQNLIESDPNNTSYALFSILTKATKKVLKDSNKIDEKRRTLLSGIFKNLEELPAVRFVKNSSLISKIDIFSRLFQKIVLHMMNNRPIVDDVLINKLIKRKLNVSPKWTIVHQELQTLPNKKLEALIENTECSRENKIRLYNSIVSGDFGCFSDTIDSCEREAKILIIYAYELDFYNNRFLNIIDELRSTYPNGILACSNDDLDLIQDSFLVESPFRSNSSRTVGGGYLVYQREQLVYTWFKMVDALEMIKQGAYSSERRQFDRVLNRMEQYTEFKEARDKSKTTQDRLLDDKNTGNEDEAKEITNDNESLEDPSKKDTGKKSKTRGIVPNYITFSKRNLDIDKLVRLLIEPDKINGNSRFITLIQCDTQSADVATCLKHFLGITSPSPLSFKLKWNDNIVGLKLLIRLLVNTNEKATRKNVIKYRIVDGVPKPYDGISNKYVSDGKGQTAIWPSVREAFQGCKSITQADLGDTKSAWEKNMKQLETVAKIYFECKK